MGHTLMFPTPEKKREKKTKLPREEGQQTRTVNFMLW